MTVTVESDGRVSDVRVDPQWIRRLAPDELGGAVVAAVNEAALRRIGAWVAATEDVADGTDDRSGAVRAHSGAVRGLDGGGHGPGDPAPLRLPEIPPPGRLGDLSDPTIEANIAELFKLVSDARAAIGAAGQRLERWATARTSGRSPGREVVVTLQGQQPVEVQVTPAWAREANANEIGAAIRKAFAAAYREHPPLTIDDLVAGSPLAAPA